MLHKMLINIFKGCLVEYLTNHLITLDTGKQYLLILPEKMPERELNDVLQQLVGKINMIVIQSDHFKLIEFKIGE